MPGTARNAPQPWQNEDEDEDEPDNRAALLDVILEELAELRVAVKASQREPAATFTADALTDADRKNGNGAG